MRSRLHDDLAVLAESGLGAGDDAEIARQWRDMADLAEKYQR
jgi:hypothetical protein